MKMEGFWCKVISYLQKILIGLGLSTLMSMLLIKAQSQLTQTILHFLILIMDPSPKNRQENK